MVALGLHTGLSYAKKLVRPIVQRDSRERSKEKKKRNSDIC